MKKLLSVFLILVICIGAFVGCSSERTKGAPNGMKAVKSDDTLSYNLYIPAAWIQDLSTGAVSAYCSSADLSNVSMTQFTLSNKFSLSEQVEVYLEGLKNTFSDFTIDEKYPENVTLDGVAASKIEYTATLAGDQYKFMNIICVVGAEMYIFTYTSTVDLYDSHLEDVQSILDNFAFIR